MPLEMDKNQVVSAILVHFWISGGMSRPSPPTCTIMNWPACNKALKRHDL